MASDSQNGELIVSYSGLRGIAGTALTADVAARYGHAFGQLLPKGATILVARDTRPSGPELLAGLVRGLAPFATIVDLGIVPTPTLQLAVGAFDATGGVCVTASHNPRPWNGLKFFLGSPPPVIVLGGAEMKRLIALAKDAVPGTSAPALSNRHEDAVAVHLEAVLREVDVAAIARRGFRVAIDSARGAGTEITRRLLDALGCHTHVVDADRESEPTAEHLRELSAAVVRERCDVGFAQDLDADRLALVAPDGTIPGEDTTLVLAVAHLLRRFPGSVIVKNVATTRAVDDVAKEQGATIVETPVGEVNLSRALIAATTSGRTAFGGEGNGGVIHPRILYGRDSLTGIALTLEALLTREIPRPKWHMVKAKLAAPPDLEALFAKARATFPEARADRSDGLRLTFPDESWLIIRASNTEPVVRVIAESRNPAWPRMVVGKM